MTTTKTAVCRTCDEKRVFQQYGDRYVCPVCGREMMPNGMFVKRPTIADKKDRRHQHVR